MAFVALWLGAAAAFLASGLLLLLLMILTANPGWELFVTMLKAVLAIGWLLIGLWQMVQLFERRWRFLLAPFGAWIWTWVLGLFLGSAATLNWGY